MDKADDKKVTAEELSAEKPVEEVVSEPAEEQAPAKEAEPTEATAEVSKPVAVEPAVLEPEPKPKKKNPLKKLLIFILILVVLAGGGFAIWYFAYYNNPQVVLRDALSNLVSAEHIGISSIDGAFTQKDYYTTVATSFELKPMALGVPTSTNGEFNVSYRNNITNDSSEFKIGLGSRVMADGTIYFQVNNLMSTLDTFRKSEGKKLSDLSTSERMVYDVAEMIDNEWWQFKLDDLLEALAVEQNDSTAAVVDAYNCMFDTFKMDDRDELKKLYVAHPFIRLVKVQSGVTAEKDSSEYAVHVDYKLLADFVNELPRTSRAEASYVCINKALKAFGAPDEMVISAENIDEVDADDLEESMPENLHVNLVISDWGHKLKSVIVAAMEVPEGQEYSSGSAGNGQGDESEEYVAGSAEITLDYEAHPVSAPDGYKPLTDLIEEIYELIARGLTELEESYTGGMF